MHATERFVIYDELKLLYDQSFPQCFIMCMPGVSCGVHRPVAQLSMLESRMRLLTVTDPVHLSGCIVSNNMCNADQQDARSIGKTKSVRRTCLYDENVMLTLLW
jgi:hypothetical protein